MRTEFDALGPGQRAPERLCRSGWGLRGLLLGGEMVEAHVLSGQDPPWRTPSQVRVGWPDRGGDSRGLDRSSGGPGFRLAVPVLERPDRLRCLRAPQFSPAHRRAAAPHHGAHRASREHQHSALRAGGRTAVAGNHLARAHHGAALFLALVCRHLTPLRAQRLQPPLLDRL